MIEPNFNDLGREVNLVFSYKTVKKGYITKFDDKYVYVRWHGADQAQRVIRAFLRWSNDNG